MSRPMTDTPAATTLRVRLHRKRRKLLSDLQQLVYSKDNNVALNALQNVIETLTKEDNQDEKNLVSE